MLGRQELVAQALALGVGVVLMVFAERRPLGKRLAGVSAVVVVAISLGGFIALLTQIPA